PRRLTPDHLDQVTATWNGREHAPPTSVGARATAGSSLSTMLNSAERGNGYGVIEEAAGVGGVEAVVAARAAAELTGTEAGVTDEQAVVERGVRRPPPSAEPVGAAGRADA